MWLYIGVVGMEEAAGAVYSEALDAVDIGLATLVAIIWQNLGSNFFLIPFTKVSIIFATNSYAIEMRVTFGLFIGKY